MASFSTVSQRDYNAGGLHMLQWTGAQPPDFHEALAYRARAALRFKAAPQPVSTWAGGSERLWLLYPL